MSESLFNKNITPACSYCEFGKQSADGTMVECKKSGFVSPYFRCKKFKYSPIRRIPHKGQKLPKVHPEDFAL